MNKKVERLNRQIDEYAKKQDGIIEQAISLAQRQLSVSSASNAHNTSVNEWLKSHAAGQTKDLFMESIDEHENPLLNSIRTSNLATNRITQDQIEN